jgi:hypothetical protein
MSATPFINAAQGPNRRIACAYFPSSHCQGGEPSKTVQSMDNGICPRDRLLRPAATGGGLGRPDRLFEAASHGRSPRAEDDARIAAKARDGGASWSSNCVLRYSWVWLRGGSAPAVQTISVPPRPKLKVCVARRGPIRLVVGSRTQLEPSQYGPAWVEAAAVLFCLARGFP